MTYERCAFLGGMVSKKAFKGSLVCTYKCTNPKYPSNVCIPSYYPPGEGEYIGNACSCFRIKSVMNSFDAGKKGGR